MQVPLAFFHSFLKLLAVTDDAAFYHFTQQVVAFSGAFAHAGEHGEAVVPFGDVVDQLHDEHRLAHACTAEKADFTAFAVRLEQVYHLNAGSQNLGADGEVVEFRRRLVDGTQVGFGECRQVVDSVAEHVEQASFNLVAGGHCYRMPHADSRHAAAESVGALHRKAAHGVLAYVLLYFESEESAVGTVDFERRIDGWQACFKAFEHHIDNRADDLRGFTD